MAGEKAQVHRELLPLKVNQHTCLTFHLSRLCPGQKPVVKELGAGRAKRKTRGCRSEGFSHLPGVWGMGVGGVGGVMIRI